MGFLNSAAYSAPFDLSACLKTVGERIGGKTSTVAKIRTLDDLSTARSLLSDESVAALKAAHDSGEYKVRIFERTQNGVSQKVVFLGETHAKTPEAAKLGDHVVQHFPVRGLEGVDLSKYWAGKFMSQLIEAVGRGLKSKGMTEGSTISRAGGLFDPEEARKILEALAKLPKEKRAELSIEVGSGYTRKTYDFDGFVKLLEESAGVRHSAQECYARITYCKLLGRLKFFRIFSPCA